MEMKVVILVMLFLSTRCFDNDKTEMERFQIGSLKHLYIYDHQEYRLLFHK